MTSPFRHRVQRIKRDLRNLQRTWRGRYRAGDWMKVQDHLSDITSQWGWDAILNLADTYRIYWQVEPDGVGSMKIRMNLDSLEVSDPVKALTALIRHSIPTYVVPSKVISPQKGPIPPDPVPPDDPYGYNKSLGTPLTPMVYYPPVKVTPETLDAIKEELKKHLSMYDSGMISKETLLGAFNPPDPRQKRPPKEEIVPTTPVKRKVILD